VALFWCLYPPGGTRRELSEEMLRIRSQIAATHGSAARVKNMAAKVQLGHQQQVAFESQYFLPRRTAYQQVLAELQRLAKASGVQAGDSVNTDEPIEGSDNLSLLSVSQRFDGTYSQFVKFLYEVDKSPMLLMLDSLAATPRQNSGRITADLRFQTIIREDAPALELTGGKR
jgi:Tfp pilus assembly protein PilO